MADNLKLHATWGKGNSGDDLYFEADVPLRDLFAVFALAGILANSSYDPYALESKENAEVAYENADAMLKAREEPPNA